MSEQVSLLVQEYYKTNSFAGVLDSYNAHALVGNSLCDDSIEVYLQIVADEVVDYSYSGAPSALTKAAAEFLGDMILGSPLDTILELDADRVRSEGFEVSPRRIRSSVSVLLAVRNAIHLYLRDGLRDEYEDLIPLG